MTKPEQMHTFLLFLVITLFCTISYKVQATKNPFKSSENIEQTQTLKQQIKAYENAIETIESQDGVYSDKLAQQLANLADIYQRQNKHDLAIDTFNRSLHLNRINDGLYSKAQIPLLKKIIASLKIQKKWKIIDQRYNYLYWLHNRNFSENDETMVEVLLEIAGWNLTSYARRYSKKPIENLYNSHILYTKALKISEEQYGQFNERNIPILNNIMIANYFFATADIMTSDLIEPNEYAATTNFQNLVATLKRKSFSSGKENIQNEIQILENQDEINHFQISNVRLKLADWHLLFEKRQTAMRLYNDAYLYASINDSQNINDLFNKPIALPNLPNLKTNTREGITHEALASNTKFIHASFDVTRYGRAKNIQVINSNMKESTRLRSLALRSLRFTKFRPKLVGGLPIKTEKMNLHIFPE
ncbi:tetratricopeptide repeat protein [Pseudoalteromonas denitrificans]|uniref:Uncharacterized protein n=1 Tax=Pseudoalteromonas denitrificans DSM 6059 TaxID=1123010 RepID=A0A1I1FP98_9GAMM|nr:tetratricopeptide repeat protein [Pseudoalteromonas denitrificans]SFB98923.1 hypothetical protein SAMN02745724_00643 [Pseudoalteromonas denitrificans DSM 6059]